MKMKNSSMFILCILGALIIRCTPDKQRIVERFIVGSASNQKDTVVIDFTKLPFDWDTVYFFSGKIDSPKEIRTILKDSDYNCINEPGSRIIFKNKGSVVYEEDWFTTSRYANYIYYHNNDSYRLFPREAPLFLVWSCLPNTEREFIIIDSFPNDLL